MQQLTGDYPAAAASHQQALELFRDLGERLGQAEALNSLGELLVPDLGQPAGPRLPHPGAGHRPRPRRAPGGSTRPGRHRPLPHPRRQPRRRRREPTAGTGDLPAHRSPRCPARPGNPPQLQLARPGPGLACPGEATRTPGPVHRRPATGEQGSGAGPGNLLRRAASRDDGANAKVSGSPEPRAGRASLRQALQIYTGHGQRRQPGRPAWAARPARAGLTGGRPGSTRLQQAFNPLR